MSMQSGTEDKQKVGQLVQSMIDNSEFGDHTNIYVHHSDGTWYATLDHKPDAIMERLSAALDQLDAKDTEIAQQATLLGTAKEALTAVIEDDRKTIGKLESDLAAVTAEAKRYMSQIAERDATIARQMEEMAFWKNAAENVYASGKRQALKEPNP